MKEPKQKRRKTEETSKEGTSQEQKVTIVFKNFEGDELFTYQIEVRLIDHIPVLDNMIKNFEIESNQIPVNFKDHLTQNDVALLISCLREYHSLPPETKEDWLTTKIRDLQSLPLDKLLILLALTDYLDINLMNILFVQVIALNISRLQPLERGKVLQSIDPEAEVILAKEIVKINRLSFRLMGCHLHSKANRASQSTGLPSERIICQFERYRRINWSPKCNYRALESDSKVEIWKLGESPVKLYHFQDDQAISLEVNWSPDEKYFLTSGVGARIEVRETSTGQIQTILQEANGVDDLWVAWSPDGQIVVVHPGDIYSENEKGETEIWDVKDKQKPKKLCELLPKNKLRSVAPILSWNSTGEFILMVNQDSVANILNGRTGKVIRSYHQDTKVYNALWNPDGKYYLVMSDDQQNPVYVQGVKSDLLPHMVGLGGERIGDSRAVKVEWSPNGEKLLIMPNNRRANILDPKTGLTVRVFQFDHLIRSMIWSPKGKYLMAFPKIRGGPGEELETPKVIQVYNSQTGEFLYNLYGTDGNWSPNGEYLMTEAKDTYIWEAATGQLVYIFKGYEGEWSPDSRYFLLGDDEAALIREVHDPEFAAIVNNLSFENILRLLYWLKEGKLNQITENWETYFPPH